MRPFSCVDSRAPKQDRRVETGVDPHVDDGPKNKQNHGILLLAASGQDGEYLLVRAWGPSCACFPTGRSPPLRAPRRGTFPRRKERRRRPLPGQRSVSVPGDFFTWKRDAISPSAKYVANPSLYTYVIWHTYSIIRYCRQIQGKGEDSRNFVSFHDNEIQFLKTCILDTRIWIHSWSILVSTQNI